ncbi:MAG: hypothetical protein AB8B82_05305 [Roseovarius sp.]
MSLAALITAYVNWWLHLLACPDKQAKLARLSVTDPRMWTSIPPGCNLSTSGICFFED